MEKVNMDGKVVLVTGGTNGIGKVTALELAKMGATVVIIGRNPAKTTAVEAEIRQAVSGGGKVDSIIADLSSLTEIRQAAQTFLARYDRLDVLVNNAGGFFAKRLESADGYEMTFALNHLNYFLLTKELLDILKKSAPARIVNVSSGAHYGNHVDFGDLQRKKKYRNWQVYGESKLMNILFTRALAKRLEGSGVTVNALHPGFVATNFGHGKGIMDIMIKFAQKLFAISEDEGAKTSIYLASSPEVAGISGEYFYQCQVKQASDAAYDDQAAEKLWQISEQIVNK